MNSGSEVVGAAMMPPVDLLVSALSVISERTTASRQGPRYVQCWIQSAHHRSASSIARDTSSCGGGGWCEGYQVKMNGTRSPFETVKSATVVKFSPRVFTGV